MNHFIYNSCVTGKHFRLLSASSSRYLSFKPVNRPERFVVVHQAVDEHRTDSFSREQDTNHLDSTFKGDRLSGTFVENDKPSRTETLVKNFGKHFQSVESAKNASHQLVLRTATHLLPKDFPNSVGPAYMQYAQWSALAGVAGTVSGVLSMQSLLFAMGLSAGTVPLAAALNWIIKDGLGQLGGVIYASTIHHRFDSDPKRWRFTAGAVYDASIVVEVLTPLFPAYFLPLASVANVGKNVGWLSASATRAAIHKSLIRRENLADVTAKAGSQTIAASVVGTAIGVVVSPWIGTDPYHVLCATMCCIVVHLGCIHKSLSGVVLPTMNLQRGWLSIRNAITTNKESPIQLDRLLPPAQVSPYERFVHLGRWGGPNGEIILEDENNSSSYVRLEIGTPLGQFANKLEDFEHAVELAEAANAKHILRIKALDGKKSMVTTGISKEMVRQIQTPSHSVQLVFMNDATEDDVTQGILHAFIAAKFLQSDLSAKFPNYTISQETLDYLAAESRAIMNSQGVTVRDFTEKMDQLGWDTSYMQWEERKSRIWIAETLTTTTTNSAQLEEEANRSRVAT